MKRKPEWLNFTTWVGVIKQGAGGLPYSPLSLMKLNHMTSSIEWGLGPFCPPPYPQHPAHHLPHKRHLIKSCWMNEWAKDGKPISTCSFSCFAKDTEKPFHFCWPSPTFLKALWSQRRAGRLAQSFILMLEILKFVLVHPLSLKCLAQCLSCLSLRVCLVRKISPR